MAADLELIIATWHALRLLLAEEKCATCECLQGALVVLKMDLEELSSGGEQTDLLSVIEAGLRRGEPHACSGCQPCNPADILAGYYRAQRAGASATPCCADG
jgi:hypothetical protein